MLSQKKKQYETKIHLLFLKNYSSVAGCKGETGFILYMQQHNNGAEIGPGPQLH